MCSYKNITHRHRFHIIWSQQYLPWNIDRADCKLASSQRETSLQSNTVSHWLGANLQSVLIDMMLKEKETQHSFAGLLNIYISGIWLWYMQALFINRVKQNRCLKSENPQPMAVTLLPPCSGNQMWMWCSVVSSPAWWLITPSPIPEAARCQFLLRAGQLRYLNVSARKMPPRLLNCSARRW